MSGMLWTVSLLSLYPSPQQWDPPHDGTDITRQVPAAGSGCKILLWVQPVSVNHEVSVGQVAYRREEQERKTIER